MVLLATVDESSMAARIMFSIIIQATSPVSNHKLDSGKAWEQDYKQTNRMHGSMGRFSFQTMTCSATSFVLERYRLRNSWPQSYTVGGRGSFEDVSVCWDCYGLLNQCTQIAHS